MFGQLFATRFAIPLLEGVAGDLAFDKELCEFAPLRLALERHEPSCWAVYVREAKTAQPLSRFRLPPVVQAIKRRLLCREPDV